MKARNALLAAFTLSTLATAVQAADEVVVYSARIDELIKPVFDAYTEKTGVKVKFITDKEAPLIARLKAEGANTPADLLITVDAGNLWQAEQEGVLQPTKSDIIDANIPAQYRSSTDSWTGLSLRARTIFYSTERVKPEELIVKGWVNNLATDVFPDDTALLQAIDAGQCDVGITNTYYYGRLHKQQPDLKVKPFWPNQNDRGVHVNLAGAGVTKHAPHAEQARKLLEWMTTPEAQSIFAGVNQEFPANPAVAPSKEVAAWGTFKADSVATEVAGKRQAEATMLMDRAGWQ
ncbi:MAG: iron ABC transporter substrate-binding protein [Pseudomonas sp. 34-62-33]|nr:MAG: iron ABC transporter substrate-binding protein [Pseudomonas sp. 34-62-33]